MFEKTKFIPLLCFEHCHCVSDDGTERSGYGNPDRLCNFRLSYKEIDKFIKDHGENGLSQVCSLLNELRQTLKSRIIPENKKLNEKKQLNRIQALEI